MSSKESKQWIDWKDNELIGSAQTKRVKQKILHNNNNHMGHEKIKNLQQPRLKQTAFVPKKILYPQIKRKRKIQS